MDQHEVRNFLRAMGFSEPCPEYTMSKIIPTPKGNIRLQVWASDNPYIYFSTYRTDVDPNYPYEVLGIKCGTYPKVTCKEDVENVCLKLSGKSIYEINIPEPPEERKEIMECWAIINGYKKPNIPKKSFFQRLFKN